MFDSQRATYGQLRGTRGFGKNRPSGFLIRPRTRFTAVTIGVRRSFRRPTRASESRGGTRAGGPPPVHASAEPRWALRAARTP